MSFMVRLEVFAVTFAVTGKGNESTSDEVKDLARIRRVQGVINKVSARTEPTQVSRSFGKNGFCAYLGLGQFVRDEKTGQKVLKVSKSHAMYKLVAKLVDKASDATLKTMKGTGADEATA